MDKHVAGDPFQVPRPYFQLQDIMHKDQENRSKAGA